MVVLLVSREAMEEDWQETSVVCHPKSLHILLTVTPYRH